MTLISIEHLPPGTEIPFSLDEARDYLQLILSILDMLQIYEECFPDEFHGDQQKGVPLFPEADESYSQQEAHFFHLVNDHYFPMPVEFLPHDFYGERHFARSIPLSSIGFDLYDESLCLELPFGWKLLLYLLGMVEKEWHGFFQEEEACESLFAIPIEKGDIRMKLLLKRCEAQGGPLAGLGLALQMLQNETDSVWLNVTMDDPCDDAFWTKEDMKEVKEHYHLALVIREKAQCFCEWLVDDPCRHFAQVTRLWNACVRDTPKRGTTGPKMREIPAGTFVEGVNFGELFGRHIALPGRRGDAEETERAGHTDLR